MLFNALYVYNLSGVFGSFTKVPVLTKIITFVKQLTILRYIGSERLTLNDSIKSRVGSDINLSNKDFISDELKFASPSRVMM